MAKLSITKQLLKDACRDGQTPYIHLDKDFNLRASGGVSTVPDVYWTVTLEIEPTGIIAVELSDGSMLGVPDYETLKCLIESKKWADAVLLGFTLNEPLPPDDSLDSANL